MALSYECKNAIIYEHDAVYSYFNWNLLFGFGSLTDESNLIVVRNAQKYIHHANIFEWYEIILCYMYVYIKNRIFIFMCITLLCGEDVLMWYNLFPIQLYIFKTLKYI